MGDKYLKHSFKECHQPFLVIQNPSDDKYACHDQFHEHFLNQLTRTRDYSKKNPNAKFEFQLKFGQFYFTNISPYILNSDKPVTLNILNQENCFNIFGSKKFDIDLNNNSFFDSILKYLNDDSFLKNPISTANKQTNKTNKKPFQKTHSAFNSIIHNNIDDLDSLLNENGFKSIMKSSNLFYLEIRYPDPKKYKSYKLEYNSNFELLNIEMLPIKWIDINIRSSNREKDVCFCLKSCQKENEAKLSQFQKCPINKDLILNSQYHQINSLQLRVLRVLKYQGDFKSWQSFLNLNESLAVHSDLFSKLEVLISNETYYSDSNVEGVFQNKNEKNSLKIISNINFDEMSQNQCETFIDIMWKISNEISKLIV